MPPPSAMWDRVQRDQAQAAAREQEYNQNQKAQLTPEQRAD